MSSLDQLVRLDDYQSYLKYRKPAGSGFAQVRWFRLSRPVLLWSGSCEESALPPLASVFLRFHISNIIYCQVANKKNVWVPNDEGGYSHAVVIDESDPNVTVVQVVKNEAVRLSFF